MAIKLRFGIGLAELIGASAAAELRALPPPRGEPPPVAPPWVRPRRPHVSPPDDQVRARAAALGITAGARGQWLRR